MGKALVVKGLKVNNPIGLVSFKGIAPAALAAYYERNTSITEAQAESLNTLVKTLINEGLWDKLHYFYPLLGSTLGDMTLECINTENEDLFATSGLSGLSVDGAYMSIDNTRDKSTFYPTSITAISPSDVSIIMAGGSPYLQSPIFMDASNGKKRIELTTFSAGGAPMRMSCGATEGGTTSNITGVALGTSTLERVVCGTINNGNGVIWNDKSKYAEGTGNTDFNVGRCGYVFAQSGNNTIAKFAFFAMGRYMTEAEWGKFYDALLIFLKATGKHS